MKDKIFPGIFEVFIVPIALFCAICFLMVYGISNAIYYVAKKIWSPFDFLFVPHKENIIGTLVDCEKTKEYIPYYDPNETTMLASPLIFADRYFLIVEKGAKKTVRVLVTKRMYDEMSKSKGKIISLFCKKCGVDTAYQPVVET